MSSVNNAGGLMTGTGFSSQCFPVRGLTRYKRQDENGGAWLVAYRAEQRRRFKAVLCGDPSTSTEWLIKKPKSEEGEFAEAEDETSKKTLDGFFLMKQFHVEDPSDLCTIRISGQELREVNDDDFLLFDNVVHVDAGDNSLPFASFNKFTSLQELELPLNNICNTVRVEPDMFVNLMTLDLSYNRLTGDDILSLGLLGNLRTLHLTGNEIKELPIEMTRTYRTVIGVTYSGTVESQEKRLRFPALENLYLDHNELTDLATFASLAGLRKLKYLNLEHNEISSVPYLRLLGARVRQQGNPQQGHLEKKSDSMSDTPLNNNEDGNQGEGSSSPVPEEHEKGDKEKQKSEFNLDDVDEILSRGLIDENPSEQRHPEINPRSSTLTEDPTLLGDRFNPPVPFPNLLHLNLANNLIFEEEGLLALMSWPYLRELVIWGNPLTTAFKGDPPIMSIQLGKLKGVRIFRKKPPKRLKPTVNLVNTHRKVDDALPPMPKKQNLAMLEGPPLKGPAYRTLPPIGSAPPTGRRHQKDATPRKLATAPGIGHTTPRPKDVSDGSDPANRAPPTEQQYQSVRSTRQTARTEGEVTNFENVETEGDRQQPLVEGQINPDDGFFMTQVGELEVGEDGEALKKRSTVEKQIKKERPFSVETKYKGYEDLLDVDEDDADGVVPSDIQANVRALQYALAHTLVFSDPQGKYKERRVAKSKSVSVSTGQKSGHSKVEELGSILDKMRVQSKTKESNLGTLLQDFKKDPQLRKEYHEAKKLLNEVQTKYNEVRVASLKPSATARELFGSQLENRSVTIGEPAGEADIKLKSLRRDKTITGELKRFKQNIDSRI